MKKLAVPTSSSLIHNLFSFRQFETFAKGFQSQFKIVTTDVIGSPMVERPCRGVNVYVFL